jgi:hypothetical protein
VNFLIDAYWIRELLYIESTLPSKTWFKSNIIEHESIDHYIQDSIENKTNQQEQDEVLIDQSNGIELTKLLDILDMLCRQSKQVLEYEINLEIMLKQLLTIKKNSNFR